MEPPGAPLLQGPDPHSRPSCRRRRGSWLAPLLGALAAFVLWLALPAPAQAKPWRPKFMENVELPRWDLSLGAGGNALVDSQVGNGGGVVLDFSLLYGTLWASLGFGVGFAEQTQFRVYAEAGVWAILNLGVGWSGLVERSPTRAELQQDPSPCRACGPSTGPHVFVGLPLGRQVYVEPYYRVTFLVVGRDSFLHEAGLLIKYTTWKWIR